MKNKCTLLLTAFLAFAIAAPLAQAQSLVEKTPAQADVESISRDRDQALNFLEAKLNSMYRKLTAGTTEEIEARLALMGAKAVPVMAEYAAARNLILASRPDATVPAPNIEVFVPQADGTVKYVAPPKPEQPTPPAP